MSCSCNGESDDVENFDPELTARLIEIRNTELRQVEMALERLEQDEYGLCVDCGEDISQKRLIAMPFAVRCKDCEEKTEQHPKSA
ncbi:MAG: TraR/DksA C4-type zinc finger protein [Candidatus Yanofskybacteria bacterium]|nr:TraR/DksA C4-type zinc finger protein [Candidatus Yanofskybacteria bacterium]